MDYTDLVKHLREHWGEYSNEAADAIEELQAAQEWIPVTERLPEYGGSYITAFSKGEVGHNLYMTFADGSGKWYQNSEDTGEVTHWMPLPEPPKEETE